MFRLPIPVCDQSGVAARNQPPIVSPEPSDEQPCGESRKSGDFAEAAWDCLQPAAGTAKVWGVENRRAVPKTSQFHGFLAF